MKNLKNSIIEKLKQKVIRGFKPEVVLLDDVSKMLEDYIVISKRELRERLTRLEQGKRKTDNAVVIASRLSLTYLIKEILERAKS